MNSYSKQEAILAATSVIADIEKARDQQRTILLNKEAWKRFFFLDMDFEMNKIEFYCGRQEDLARLVLWKAHHALGELELSNEEIKAVYDFWQQETK